MDIFRKTMQSAFLVAASILASGAGTARAGFVSGLYNTGVDDSGTTQGAGALDAHDKVVASVDGPGTAHVVDPANLPNGWLADSPVGSKGSMWISGPTDPINRNDPNGPFDSQTTFKVDGTADASTVIGGLFTGDDQVEILLNGTVAVPFTASHSSDRFTAFTISGGFVAGADKINTLDFVVQNPAGGPQGVRVRMVPEPASVAMIATGLGATLIGSWVKRRKAATA